MSWTIEEKQTWYKSQQIKRSYLKEVVTKIKSLETNFDLIPYGALTINPDLYPLYLLKSKNFDTAKKSILITGGVHGYETSGVHGALKALEESARKYSEKFNFVCAPCLSPWSYETINRWNSKAIDPNRSFYKDSPAEECQLFMNIIANQKIKPFAHFDLHETTDTDNTIFRPALESRDGVTHEFSEIPDGFYLVGDSENPQKEFQKAIIDAVKKITHIAPADKSGKLIGVLLEQDGVINYGLKKLFLCTGLTQAEYKTTTEVYPDSPMVTNAVCEEAQVAAVIGGLEYVTCL